MPPDAQPTATHILTVVLIILMTATTFTTQRQLILKNSASDNPMVKQQKILMYVFPLIFLFSGLAFPVGVLIYWLTTNLWTMGQQFWVIRNNPIPNSPAHAAYLERQKAKGSKEGRKEGRLRCGRSCRGRGRGRTGEARDPCGSSRSVSPGLSVAQERPTPAAESSSSGTPQRRKSLGWTSEGSNKKDLEPSEILHIGTKRTLRQWLVHWFTADHPVDGHCQRAWDGINHG